MFELTWTAQLTNMVTGFVLGFGWTAGVWAWNWLTVRRPTPPQPVK